MMGRGCVVGRVYLPTEAEWEYAARAGTTTAAYNGDLNVMTGESAVFGPIAWYMENSSGSTHPVGHKLASTNGLFDMLGHVREWCHDWYDDYSRGPETDPVGPLVGSYRVLRGGCWDSRAWLARAAVRGSDSPGIRSGNIGGRAIKSAP